MVPTKLYDTCGGILLILLNWSDLHKSLTLILRKLLQEREKSRLIVRFL